MPEYEKNLGYSKANTDIDLLNQVIDVKITCNEVALRFGETLEEATLCWFQILLDRLNVQSEKGNYFDRQLSILMEKDVIAPQVTYGTYKSECFERINQYSDFDEEPYDEFIDLHNDLYQAGRRGVSTLPMFILKHPATSFQCSPLLQVIQEIKKPSKEGFFNPDIWTLVLK